MFALKDEIEQGVSFKDWNLNRNNIDINDQRNIPPETVNNLLFENKHNDWRFSITRYVLIRLCLSS